MERKTIVALFAHPDDELGAIGTLANHIAQGDKVILAWTTYGEYTTLIDATPEEIKKIRKQHGKEVQRILHADSIHFFDFGDTQVENSRDARVQVAKFYSQVKPDAVITWGAHNNHPDHKNTSSLALDAIKLARIKRIVESPHRQNVKFLSYYEKQAVLDVKYIDVTDSLEQILAVGEYYGNIYQWDNVRDWLRDSRRAKGIEAGCKYAEKFNVRFETNKPSKYLFS